MADSCIWIEVTPQDFSRDAQLRLVYSNTKRETSWTALGHPATVTTGAPATHHDQLPEVGVVLPEGNSDTPYQVVRSTSQGPSGAAGAKRHVRRVRTVSELVIGYVLMILPQVHLRKPCYDFSFL